MVTNKPLDPKELANRIWNHFQSKLPAPHITLEFMPENDRGAFVGAVESVLASIPATRMPELPSNEKKEAITIREYRKLPNELPLTIPPDWEALTHVDATPDKEYVLRILRAHLSNCEARWSGSESELKKYMNKQQDERAKLLKAAIIVLAAPKEELE